MRLIVMISPAEEGSAREIQIFATVHFASFSAPSR
jgi:hypothetical protein